MTATHLALSLPVTPHHHHHVPLPQPAYSRSLVSPSPSTNRILSSRRPCTHNYKPSHARSNFCRLFHPAPSIPHQPTALRFQRTDPTRPTNQPTDRLTDPTRPPELIMTHTTSDFDLIYLCRLSAHTPLYSSTTPHARTLALSPFRHSRTRSPRLHPLLDNATCTHPRTCLRPLPLIVSHSCSTTLARCARPSLPLLDMLARTACHARPKSP